jgi:hypothetical protein
MDIVGIKKKLFIIPYNNRQFINKYLYIITLGQELNQNIHINYSVGTKSTN